MYRDKFNDVVKSDEQTYIMMTSNLFALLDGYTEASKITELKDLKNLLVADRLKTTFNPTSLRHVLSVEAKSDKGWLPAYELAEIADHIQICTKQTKPNAFFLDRSVHSLTNRLVEILKTRYATLK